MFNLAQKLTHKQYLTLDCLPAVGLIYLFYSFWFYLIGIKFDRLIDWPQFYFVNFGVKFHSNFFCINFGVKAWKVSSTWYETRLFIKCSLFRFGQIFGLNVRASATDNTCTEFEFSALQVTTIIPYFFYIYIYVKGPQ